MWMYHITAEKSEHGFYRIPKTCVNAEFGNFEKLLETDERRLIKSAIVNWFNDIHKNKDFSVGMNGYDSIILFSSENWNEEHDYYFHCFSVMDDYLLYHENEREYNEIREKYKGLRIVLQRKNKLEKITQKID